MLFEFSILSNSCVCAPRDPHKLTTDGTNVQFSAFQIDAACLFLILVRSNVLHEILAVDRNPI